MQSALYTGRLRHRRYTPVEHFFEYRLFMVWIDLAELDQVFRGRWFWSAHRPALAWLRRADYLGEAHVPLDQAVRDHVERETGMRPLGPVRLLTHLRTFGHCFNPVSFYYCYDPAGERIESVVAEITNTPWKERQAYVLPAHASKAPGEILHFQFGKMFHVSPFMPMQLQYDWRFTIPGSKLAVHMENQAAGETVFDATLMLERREMNGANLAGVLMRFPFVTVQVLFGIYWQALRLWLKRVPIYAHPSKRGTEKVT